MQLAHEKEEDLNYNLRSKITIVMNHIKLLVFSIITAVTRVAGILFWYYHASLPSCITATAHRKQRLYTPFHFNRERLSQPLSNFIFLWLMLSTRYLKFTSKCKSLMRVFALHLCVTLHPCSGTLCPITHRSHFLITRLPFGWSPTSALSEHRTQSKKER